VDVFRRIREDEDKHALVFGAFAAALDDAGALRAGESADGLAGRLSAAGTSFLPRARRAGAESNPAGSGGAVVCLEGAPGAGRAVLRCSLEDGGLAALVAERSRALGRPLRVAIKASFMLGYDRRDLSPLVDPALVDELASWLRERGCGDVAVLEAPNVYDRFYRRRSVEEVAAHFGFASERYRIVDAQAEQEPHAFARGIGQRTISRTWRAADVRITFGKLRSHPCSLVHLALANLEGLGARSDEYIFAERHAHRDTAVLMVQEDFPAHFALLDAYETAADGMVGIMGSPAPKAPRRIYAAADPLALDLVVARHAGIADPRRVSLLRSACDWFGDPQSRLAVRGLDAPLAEWRGPYSTDWNAFLSLFAFPAYAYGSGRGALFVPPMDEAAFPPLEPPSLALRVTRRGLQSLVGLR
jgi:hypothetical protein